MTEGVFTVLEAAERLGAARRAAVGGDTSMTGQEVGALADSLSRSFTGISGDEASMIDDISTGLRMLSMALRRVLASLSAEEAGGAGEN